MDPKPKPTARVPMKPATGKVPTTAAGAATKGNTSRIQKKGTERVPTGTARATPRKKNNPIVLAGLCVLVLGIVVAVYLFVRDPREPWEIVLKRLQSRELAAAQAERSADLDGATRLWAEALTDAETCGYPDRTSGMKTVYKVRVEELKGAKANRAKREEEWRQLKAAYDKLVAGTGDKLDWIAKARSLSQSFEDMPWVAEFRAARDHVDGLIEKERKELEALQWLNFRAMLVRDHNYANSTDGMWGPAVKALRDYVKDDRVTAADKSSAERAIIDTENRAKDALGAFGRKAERMDRSEAKKYLEARKEQFKGTAVEAEFDQLIQRYS